MSQPVDRQSEGEALYICGVETCEFKTKNKNSLHSHMGTHRGYNYPCAHCMTPFRTERLKKIHEDAYRKPAMGNLQGRKKIWIPHGFVVRPSNNIEKIKERIQTSSEVSHDTGESSKSPEKTVEEE